MGKDLPALSPRHVAEQVASKLKTSIFRCISGVLGKISTARQVTGKLRLPVGYFRCKLYALRGMYG